MSAQNLMPGSATLDMPRVTLAVVTSIAPQASARAMMKSCQGITFGSLLWISDLPPPDCLPSKTLWHKIERIGSRDEYSRFIIQDLAALVETDHILLVQWDGYVLDPKQWRSDFLDYDYIGPVWPHFPTMNVGNGGFSLRSRRLLGICAELQYVKGEAEDIFICRSMRKHLEQCHEIRFAAPEIASFFAYERARERNDTFGFHGVFNLFQFISGLEAVDILSELPMHSLSSGEIRELLYISIRKRNWTLMHALLRRWHRIF